ncbi:MAG: hypothetical protein IJ207_03700 [Treponema sp.]|uniref:DUF6273 domain-containing protein n=1 Tax=Treponema sp. TaxID=166 RepID=UPI0025DF0276|nr:DUF6273 domain-containing protein [Treponema sp.]MBQ9281284.1 hypothetical protein [Treponema sp.]
MKVALLAQSIEDLGAEILNITKKNTFGGGNVYQIDIAEPASANPAKIEHSEVKTLPPADIFTTDVFSTIKKCCNEGVADANIKPGQKILIPHFKVPAVKDCEGEEFDEIDLENVVITAVHVEPRRVVFNFEDILFRHDVDYEESGKPFEETPLGVYLAEHFAKALKEYTGKVNVSLLSKDNVFNEDSKDFMPYFKAIKNRIKVLAFENDTWWWWLKTPYASNASSFCGVGGGGSGGNGLASYTGGGVAPAFCTC